MENNKTQKLIAYGFISILISLVILLKIIPILSNFLLGFFQWDLLSPPKFIKFNNYFILFKDPWFYKSLINTIFFIIATTFLTSIISIVITYLLKRINKWLRIIIIFLLLFPMFINKSSTGII